MVKRHRQGWNSTNTSDALHNNFTEARLSSKCILFLYLAFKPKAKGRTLKAIEYPIQKLQLGPWYASIMLITLEVKFLFAFTWPFSYSSLAPTSKVGGIRPPKGIEILDSWKIHFLNTFVLPSSGAVVIWARHATHGKGKTSCLLLISYCFTDSSIHWLSENGILRSTLDNLNGFYGYIFLATIFHGFHVIIDTLFLIVCGIHQYLGHLSKKIMLA